MLTSLEQISFPSTRLSTILKTTNFSKVRISSTNPSFAHSTFVYTIISDFRSPNISNIYLKRVTILKQV